jgi:lipoprotein-anchoring transpeptidase ErfK/SrfK
VTARALAMLLAGALAVSAPVAPAAGQAAAVAARPTPGDTTDSTSRPTVPIDEIGAAPVATRRFRSRRDSLQSEAARLVAERAKGFRVVVSLETRELSVIDGADTLLVAPVAVGMDTTITFGTKSWTFQTPRGRRAVLRKDQDPVWVPPDWHYAEVASKRGLKLAQLRASRPVKVGEGRTLTLRNNRAGLLMPDGTFGELPLDEEIIFGDTLYVPPPGSENRKIPGELGRFRLDLGNGYLLHGTPYEETVGTPVTHGCIRLYDEDIEWLYQRVPVGTAVYIY